jgi:Na+-translocating ferredoxin:NAD+ oxidoreductase RnfD subunit
MEKTPLGPCPYRRLGFYRMHRASMKLARRAFELTWPYDGEHQTFEALWFLYVPSAIPTHCIYMFHMILATYSKYCPEKRWIICHVMVTQCVLCNIGTEILNIIEMKLTLHRTFNGNCIFNRCTNLSQTMLWRWSRGGVIIFGRVIGLMVTLVRRKCYYRNLG